MSEARAQIGLRSDRGFLNLRLDPRNLDAVEAAERILGNAPPLRANTYTDGRHRIYWLGPNEWLVETEAGQANKLSRELSTALAEFHTAVNDLSGGHLALRLAGPDARKILAKGCTLDLHPREFGPGQCARSALARASVLLVAEPGDTPQFTIIVARSFADYLFRWLANATRPHGASFEPLSSQ